MDKRDTYREEAVTLAVFYGLVATMVILVAGTLWDYFNE